MSIPRLPIAVVACLAMALAGCSSGSTSKGDDAKSSSEVTLTNCGNKVTYPKVAQRLYVNDGNIIAMALSAGAAKQIAAVSSLGDDKTILAAKYGSHVIDNLHEAVKGYPTLESIIANKPDVVVAGWNYGFSEEGNLTPDKLHERGIDSYLLSESCRQKGSEKARGVMQPWDAVRTDLSNLAKRSRTSTTGLTLLTRLRRLRKPLWFCCSTQPRTPSSLAEIRADRRPSSMLRVDRMQPTMSTIRG